MDYLKEALLKKEAELQNIMDTCAKNLQGAPEGALRISKKGNTLLFYHRTGDMKEKSCGKYIKRKDSWMASALAQRDYDKSVADTAAMQMNQIKRMLNNYEKFDIESIYQSLNAYRRQLVKPMMLSDEEYAAEWEKVLYEMRVFQEDAAEIYTEKGERVLSKSEKILADKFKMMNIPYRYEYPMYLPGIGEIHPDFTVLNKRTRKEYYWEHLGMMDNPDYCEKAMFRIEQYEKNGILPGNNLIITHETTKRPLNMRVVENYIQVYLM